jgi:hypothetical protein
MVPTFGRSTIRRFVNNASAMKKLAARNFEDLLQVSNFENQFTDIYSRTAAVRNAGVRGPSR